MQLLSLIKKTTDYLEQKGIESARTEAEIIISNTLKCQRVALYADFEKTVSEEEKEEIRKIIRRRVSGEPLQHITGTQQFRFLNLNISKDVFIPRAETEVLVQIALDCVKREAKVLEIGTGTGAVALSLAKERNCKVLATDINENALELAKKNANTHGLNDNTEFIKSDIFENIKSEKFDLIISNPPYISKENMKNISAEVEKEPTAALYGGESGLRIIKSIIEAAAQYMNNSAFLLLEISSDQGESVVEIAKKSGFKKVSLEKDLTDRVRFIKCQYGRN